MTINGDACGLRAVSRHRIEFVVPLALGNVEAGTQYPVVINNNGVQMKSTVTIVPSRPDIFNFANVVGPNGRAKLFNVTNTVHTTEPFNVKTIKLRGGRLTASVMRLYLTGIERIPASLITIRIRDVTISGTQVLTGYTIVEPGVKALVAGDKATKITPHTK